MKRVAAIGIAIAIALLGLKLAASPYYQRYDAKQCRDAYAAARTHHDTVAVDMRPLALRNSSRNSRCGSVRTVPVSVLGDTLLIRRQ